MSEPNTELWLFRHATPMLDERPFCYGKLDLPLSDEGRREAARMGERMAEFPLAALYSSPRSRCRDTAAEIAHRQASSVHIVPSLREMDFGDFEGRSYDEIAAKAPEIYKLWMESPTTVEFPGGESFAQMQQRVLRAVVELRERHRGKAFGIVAHGGVNRIVLANALVMPAAAIFHIGQRYACRNLIRYYGEFASVELMNGYE